MRQGISDIECAFLLIDVSLQAKLGGLSNPSFPAMHRKEQS